MTGSLAIAAAKSAPSATAALYAAFALAQPSDEIDAELDARSSVFAAAVETLASMGTPALIFDGAGRVLAANRLMASLTSYLRWRGNSPLTFKDAGADTQFRQAANALRFAEVAPVRAFAARGGECGDAIIARIMPFRAAAGLPGQRAGVLVLTSLSPPQAPPIGLMQSLFNLTPAEARVASGLAAGETIDDLAANGKVSRNTIRSQLRVIMEKTGCHRQAEAVALFCRVAASGDCAGGAALA